MAEHDRDSRGWLRSRPLARAVIHSAEVDVPAPGLEARLLERLRSERDGTDGVARWTAEGSDFGVVDAVTEQRFDAVKLEPEPSHRARSPIPARGRARFAVYASAAALAAAAAFAIWRNREPSEQAPELSPQAARSPAAEALQSASIACEQTPRADPSLALIDDFEDGNARMLAHGGRFGTWSYVSFDVPGPPLARPLAPEESERSPRSRRALHARGVERHDWRAVWGTFGPACHDASAFAGIRFTGKGPARVTLQLSTIDDVDRKYGGLCETNCDHPYRKPVQLTDRFQTHEVRFHELAQAADAPAVARRVLDVRRLNALAFVVDPESESFDFWIDDVEWIAPR
jgi:hypothetical protein